MNLYEKLFGRVLMAPVGDEGGAGSGGADRGDNHVAPAEAAAPGAEQDGTTAEEDVKVATGEADEAEKTARDAAGKFVKKDKEDDGPMIPKSRFDAAVIKERERAEAAERRLAEIAARNGQIQRNADVSALQEQVRELRKQERMAVVDNDEEKAAALSEQADRINQAISDQRNGDITAAAKEQALEQIRWEFAIDGVTSAYPALDPKSDDFDQDLTDDVQDKMNGYVERERLSPSKAMLKAVKYIMDRQKPALATETETETGGKQGLTTTPVDRKSAAVAKNIDASNRQPASTKQAGADSDKHGQTAATPDAGDMTFEEFGALPESTKAKMRGDFV